MKNLSLSLVLMLAGLFSGAVMAEDQPAAFCKLNFSVHTDTFILVSTGGGHGVVTCYADGVETAKANVQIQIQGFGPGLGAFDVRGIARRIEIVSPEEIEGRFTVGAGNIGSIFGAVGTVMGFTGEQNGLQFDADMTSNRGIGGMLAGTTWTITLE